MFASIILSANTCDKPDIMRKPSTGSFSIKGYKFSPSIFNKLASSMAITFALLRSFFINAISPIIYLIISKSQILPKDIPSHLPPFPCIHLHDSIIQDHLEYSVEEVVHFGKIVLEAPHKINKARLPANKLSATRLSK